jgi:hypothetical protein
MPKTVTLDGHELTVFEQHEVNAAAASARREAETERDAARTQLTALEGQLQTANTATQTLQQQLEAATAATSAATKTMTGFKALVAHKIDPALADFLLQHPALAEADFTSEAGTAAALEKVKPFLPAAPATTTQVVTPPTHATGVVTPPATKTGVPLTPEAIEQMSEADILKNKDAVIAMLKTGV